MKRFFPFLFFFFTAAVLAVFRDITNVDELWNYTFARNLACGLVPYRDFNMLQTPLAAMISSLFLRLFGCHLLVIRILGAVLFAGICGILYREGRLLGAKGAFAWLIPCAFLMMYTYNVFFEYSCLILFCLLACLYTDLVSVSRPKGKMNSLDSAAWQVGIGVLAGMAIMAKQTYGGFVALAAWLAVPAVAFWRGRSWGKRLFLRLCGSAVPCFLVLFYLLAHGAWDDFLDLCVEGISTFSSSYSIPAFLKSGIENLLTGVLFVALVAFGAFWAVWKRREREGKQAMLILLYGFCGCVNLIPLANSYHVSTCLVPFLPLLILFFRKFQRLAVLRQAAVAAILAAAGYAFLWNPYQIVSDCRLATSVKHWEGIFFPKEDWEEYRKTEEWIGKKLAEGCEVYVLDNQAPLYLLPFGTYHKYLDMFLIGNLGTKTPEECLTESFTSSSWYLLPDDSRTQYQYPRQAVEDFEEANLAEVPSELTDFRTMKG